MNCIRINRKKRLSYYLLGVTLILFQCYFLFPSGLVNMLKIITPVSLLFVCLFENEVQLYNRLFLGWAVGFYLICILSIFYATPTDNMFDTFRSLTFCFLLLCAVSQYIKEPKDIETVINFMAAGGVFYAAYIFINQYNTIFTQSIDPKYTNQTIMQFTYVMIPTVYYLVYRFICHNNKLFTGFLVCFSYLMCLLSGRRKAMLFPLLLIGLMLVLKNRKNYIKVFLSLIFAIVMLVGVYYLSMNNDVLYNVIGHRIEGLILFVSGDDSGDKSAWARSYLSLTAWELFKQNPILGIGLGNFIYNNILGFYAHNNFVELLCDLGIIGAIAFYWIYIYLIVKLIKNQRIWEEKLTQFLFSLLLLNLAIDLGTISYYRVYFIMVICLASSYVCMQDKGVVCIDEDA